MNIVKKLLAKIFGESIGSAALAVRQKLELKKIKSIRHKGCSDVYCLEVPSTHMFLANGIVVHNCLDSLRYALYSHFFNKDGRHTTAQELDNNYYEATGYSPNNPFFVPGGGMGR